MPPLRNSGPPKLLRQIIELVRSGCTTKELRLEFERTAQPMANSVKQAKRDTNN